MKKVEDILESKLMQDVYKVKLFAIVDNKSIETNLFGIYSPSANKILNNCKAKFIPTTNAEFTESIKELQKFNLDIVELYSLSDGGKMCASLSFNDVYNQFDIPNKLKKNSKIKLDANLIIIESNDTYSSFQVIVQLIINNESAFLINGKETVSSYRSSSPYSVKKQELPKLIKNAIGLTNEFISTLNDLLIAPSDASTETEFISNTLIKNDKTSTYMLSMITDIESNSMLNKNLFGDNYFSLAVAFGHFLYNKYDLFIDKNLENYFFSTMKKKNDLIVKALKDFSKKIK